MLNLIINEIYKLRYKKKFLITIIIFSVLAALTCFGTYKSNESDKRNNNIDNKIQWAKEDILEYKHELKEVPKNQQKSIEQSIKNRESDLKVLKAQKLTVNMGWKESTRANLKELEKQKSSLTNTYGNNYQKEDINTSIMTYKYYLKHNIKPPEDYDNSGFKMLASVMDLMGQLFLCIIIAMMTADIVSGEYTPPTMKVLLTKPLSRTKVLFSKYIAAVLSSTITILLLEGIVFIITSLIFGMGNPNLPVLTGKRFQTAKGTVESWHRGLEPIIGSSHITTMAKYTLLTLLLQVLFIVAFVSFCFLLSTVLKTSMLSVSLSVIVYIALLIITQLPYVKAIGKFLFVPYSNPESMLQGTLAESFGNAGMTTGFGIGVLVCWAIGCYLVSQIVFTKRDLLI